MQWYGGNTDEDHAAAVIFNINGWEYVSEKLETPELPWAAQDWSYIADVERYTQAKDMLNDGATLEEIMEIYND